MRSEMIYGNPPTFEEIMQAAKQLEDEFNERKDCNLSRIRQLRTTIVINTNSIFQNSFLINRNSRNRAK